ncbi:Uncharacterised protein [Shigella sonnei]|nr:Uncharacterised protein [Shigella sonnei]
MQDMIFTCQNIIRWSVQDGGTAEFGKNRTLS